MSRPIGPNALVSLTVCLVICAALLARSLGRASSMDPGFTSEGVEVLQLDLRLAGYDEITGPRFAAELRDTALLRRDEHVARPRPRVEAGRRSHCGRRDHRQRDLREAHQAW
jgi:hypothetical protein